MTSQLTKRYRSNRINISDICSNKFLIFRETATTSWKNQIESTSVKREFVLHKL